MAAVDHEELAQSLDYIAMLHNLGPWAAETMVKAADALREAEHHRRNAPLCSEHESKGGARSGCLVCSLIKLSAALSCIDYLCSEPNEMQVSGYDVHYDEQAVVRAVERMVAEHREFICVKCGLRQERGEKIDGGF